MSVRIGDAAASAPTHARMIGWAGVFCSLMPYIGLGALPSDVQPLALLICTAGVVVWLRNPGGPVQVSYLALPLWTMALLATVSLVLRATFDDTGATWLIRAYYCYVAAPIILTFFLHYFHVLRREDVARVTDVALVVVFVGFLLNIAGMSWMIQIFVNRAEFQQFVGAGRGFRSFFPEPSRISEQMAFFFFCYLLIGQLNRLRLAALVIAGVLSAAGQVFAVLIHVILAYGMALGLVTFARRGVSLRGLRRVGLGTACVVFFLSVHDVIARDLRIVGFPTRGISAVSGMIEGGRSFIGQDISMMNKIAGVLHATATLMDHPLTFKLAAAADRLEFRDSIGDTYTWLNLTLFNSTILWFPRRVSSALGTWIIEFGVLGLIAALFFVALLMKRGMGAQPGDKLPALWAGLFLAQVLFVKVAPSNPSLWLLAALIWVTASPAAGQRARATG